jgi:hypothetical protein
MSENCDRDCKMYHTELGRGGNTNVNLELGEDCAKEGE